MKKIIYNGLALVNIAIAGAVLLASVVYVLTFGILPALIFSVFAGGVFLIGITRLLEFVEEK